MLTSFDKKDIRKGIAVLNQGGIIIYPTDTAFGVGCRIDNEKAIQRLFNIRRRPVNKAVPVLVDGITMAQKYLLPLTQIVRQLIKDYWPGALTVVYPCKTNKTPLLVRGGGNSLGVRMPDHPIPLQLIQSVGVPLLGPSANFHLQPTPYSLTAIDKNLLQLVDYIIPGECVQENISTIIDCTKRPFKIIRQGAQKIDQNFLK